MQQYPFQEDKEEMMQLLSDYENLKAGKAHHFLEEEAYIKLIDYFEDADNLVEAMTASEIALEQLPFSSELMFRKADLLIVNRKYLEALALIFKGTRALRIRQPLSEFVAILVSLHSFVFGFRPLLSKTSIRAPYAKVKQPSLIPRSGFP